MKEKLKKLFESKLNIMKCSYVISLFFATICLGLFALDLNTSSQTYQNFYMIAFNNTTSNQTWYMIAILVFFYYFVIEVYSVISNFYFKRKDPKVKSTTLKYARFSELSTAIINEIFAIYILVFFILMNKLVNDNISTSISILIGILAFLSLSFDAVGDYFDEVLSNERAREIIQERKIEEEKAKKEREENNNSTSKTTNNTNKEDNSHKE